LFFIARINSKSLPKNPPKGGKPIIEIKMSIVEIVKNFDLNKFSEKLKIENKDIIAIDSKNRKTFRYFIENRSIAENEKKANPIWEIMKNIKTFLTSLWYKAIKFGKVKVIKDINWNPNVQ